MSDFLPNLQISMFYLEVTVSMSCIFIQSGHARFNEIVKKDLIF